MKMRLTESQLHSIISETVRRVVNEIGETPRGQYALGQVEARAKLRREKAEANIKKAEEEGDYDNYDRYFDDRNKYHATVRTADEHSLNKRTLRAEEEIGSDKKFKSDKQRGSYVQAMKNANQDGYFGYLRKHRNQD